jgi:hypothetical protein
MPEVKPGRDGESSSTQGLTSGSVLEDESRGRQLRDRTHRAADAHSTHATIVRGNIECGW